MDLLLRAIAFLFAIIALLGSFWAARDGSYPNITALSQAALMLVCVVSPRRPSRVALMALLIAAMLASIDFVVRALPGLRHEKYLLDFEMIYYVVELIIAIWFIRKHFAAVGPSILRKR